MFFKRYIFCGAGAGRAGRYPPGPAQQDVDTVHAALVGLLLPEVEVDVRNVAARNPLVEKLVRLVEQALLYLVNNVAVLANDFGQRDLPDLGQLGLGEPDRGVGILVPEPAERGLQR